jgi:hypothetical protein
MAEHSVNCVPVCALSGFPHALHIGKPFSGFLGISDTYLNLGFGIPLLHRLIFFDFSMLILCVVKLNEKILLVHVIFLDLLLFVGLLTNKLVLYNPPQRPSM